MSIWNTLRAALGEASEQSRLIDIDRKSNDIIDRVWALPGPIVAPKVRKMTFAAIKKSEYLYTIGDRTFGLDRYVNEFDLAIRKLLIYLDLYRHDPLMPERYELVHLALERLIQKVDMDKVSPTVRLDLASQGISFPSKPHDENERLEESSIKALGNHDQATSPKPANYLEQSRLGFDDYDSSTWGNPSRNTPCPCGSGEKFKHCHGRLD